MNMCLRPIPIEPLSDLNGMKRVFSQLNTPNAFSLSSGCHNLDTGNYRKNLIAVFVKYNELGN
jgi:hypothetical protein